MANPQRLEALGPRGEACIVVREDVNQPNGTSQVTYKLATGERLKVTEQPGVFETLDGKRRFSLRP